MYVRLPACFRLSDFLLVCLSVCLSACLSIWLDHGISTDLGWHYLSNATCLIQESFLLCVLRRVKDHHMMLQYSLFLKNTCFRQVVLDKWFPLMTAPFLIRDSRSSLGWQCSGRMQHDANANRSIRAEGCMSLSLSIYIYTQCVYTYIYVYIYIYIHIYTL